MEHDRDPFLFPLVEEPRSRWERPGLTSAQEHVFNRVTTALVALFLAGWLYALLFVDRAALATDRAPVASISRQLTRNPLSPTAPPEPVFMVDALVSELADDLDIYRGESGAVNLVIAEPGDTAALPDVPDSIPAGEAEVALRPVEGDTTALLPAGEVPSEPGIWNVVLRMRDAVRPVSDVSVVSLVPLTERRGGRIGRYLVGTWPFERGGAPQEIYETPKGVIRVTPENRDLRVSEHFVLGEFLTKGQADVWPKYVVLSPRLLDKLELTLQELEREGHPVEHVFTVSGFRTPIYNESGGNTQGRGNLSRHMYGDAADIAIDNDRDGRMDDLNGDGRVNVRDARIVAEAAQAVERKYPHLVGGIGIYAPTGAHSGMVHIDTRGYRARWGAW